VKKLFSHVSSLSAFLSVSLPDFSPASASSISVLPSPQN
jgi:hypothetical protein